MDCTDSEERALSMLYLGLVDSVEVDTNNKLMVEECSQPRLGWLEISRPICSLLE